MTQRLVAQHLTIHGHQVAYRGAGSGPVIVLVHGMAGSSDTWQAVIPELAKRFTVIAPDLPGHGDSAKPRGDYSLGRFASSVRDLLLALGHDRATFVGHSLGGGVVLQFAYQFPERCDRIVLSSSGGLGDDVSVMLRMLSVPGAEYLLPLGCHTSVHGAGVTVAGWLQRIGLRVSPRIEEIWTSYGSLADAPTRDAFLHTLRSVVDHSGQRVSASDRLYLASEMPTMITWGDRDRIIPVEQGLAAHAAIPGSRLEVFEGRGHFPHREDPERYAAVLTDFVQTTAPSAASPELLRDRIIAGQTG